MKSVRDAARAARGGLTALAVALVVGAALLAGALEWLELRGLDVQFELRGPRPARAPVVIVGIDEDSFDELDLTWPWPRALHGALVDQVAAGRPAAIGLDILFVEPSAHGPGDDQALAEAVARAGNVVLAAALTVVREPGFVKADLNPPIAPIRDGAAGYGVVNLPVDRDAFVRAATLGVLHQGTEVPAFDRRVHEVATSAGIPSAPLPRGPGLLVNFRGGVRTFPTLPYHRVLAGAVPPDAFRGKIVLVGATSPVLHDVFPTPFAAAGMPGVEIHANVLDTLFQGNALTRGPRWAALGLVAGAAAFAVWATAVVRPLPALAMVAGLGLVHAGLGFLAFAWADRWVDQSAVPLALLLGYGASVVQHFIEAQREKQRLGRFFSPSILRAVVRQRGDVGRGRRVVTVLFSDIRDFTPIAEKLSPEDVAQFLGDYMTSMTDAVFKHGGTVVQFVGDQIMALYNAPLEQPDHATRAVRTALEFQDRLRGLSARWEARCGSRIRNGVGINTGEAVVGIIGSAQRFEYGAIGDSINLGSRLESLTKEFATPILVSETTYQAVKDQFACRPLGEVAVKGKEIRVNIYAVEPVGQRRAARVALGSPLTISETMGELEVAVPASLADLSLTGLRAADVPRRLATDQVVGLRFALPGGGEPIAAQGRVMWATDAAAGIRFVDLDAAVAARLEAFVHAGSGPGPR